MEKEIQKFDQLTELIKEKEPELYTTLQKLSSKVKENLGKKVI